MNSHDEIRGRLPAMAGDELSAADRAQVEQHLAGCPACCRELAQLRAVLQAVRSTPELDAPPWLATRIMARVRQEAVPQRSWWARLFVPLQVKLPLELFAVLTVCVIAWQVLQNLDRSVPVQPTLSSPHSPADEVAKAAPAVDVSPQVRQAEPPKVEPVPIVPPAAPPAQPLSPPPQPAFERAERDKPTVESSVAAPGLRDQAASPPTPPDQRTMAAKRAAGQADSSKKAAVVRPVLRLRIAADEPAVVVERLRPLVERLGGSLLNSNAGQAVVKLEAGRLPVFMEQLVGLGRIIERPTGALPQEGWVELQLFW